MSSLLRIFGTPLENTTAADRSDATAASQRLSKSTSQKASDVSTKASRDENRVAGQEPPAARFIHRRKRSGVIAPPVLFALQDIEEESGHEGGRNQTVSDLQDGEVSISIQGSIQSFDNGSSNHVVYSSLTSDSSLTSPSSTNEPAAPLSPDSSVLFEEVEPVPICISSENEKTAVINSFDWFGEEHDELVADCNTLSTSPICWDGSQVSLPRVQNSDGNAEQFGQLSRSEGTRRRTYPQLIKRKPVPARPLKDISRDAMMARLVATRPVTPSLLSFTEFTSPSVRRRVHPERTVHSRYVSPASDTLRRHCMERYRLLCSGVSPVLPPPPFAKPELFPRAGDFRKLHSPESHTGAFNDDWCLGYVDISFIQKTLFAFDMRMRIGSDMWEAEEDAFYREFGDNKEWERNWDMRWQIATLLLNQPDEEEEEDDEDDL